ncbi:MAG TPA: MBL fold metallo-hydrolase [Steroidobacteraceae bacterium]|nr:MBL fold metallo-hydrolase [Steroidobacteraceae bacterium]
MDDASVLGTAPRAPEPLEYLRTAPPEPGARAQVAEGVHWIRMPLPMELDHINLWLIEHEDGFVLIDTGLAADAARAAWQILERGVLAARPLRLIVLTHLHPDHAGLAAWLHGRHGAPVWTSLPTETQIRRLLAPLPPAELESRRAFFRAHGLEDLDSIEASLSGERYRRVVSGLPEIAHHPQDLEVTSWNGRSWRWLETGGHAAGHLCLHAFAPRVLVSGDQVLPTISPNVSLSGWTPDPDPLGSYLDSLERLATLDPATLVLPSHGRPFTGIRSRSLSLRDHHLRHLDQLRAACREPLTAYESLRVLFRRTLTGFHRFLALGEAIAHLEHLARRGALERQTDARGIIRYVRAA